MTLTNKWIAEGMRVTNGKQVWKVIYWNDKYTDALLQEIDRNGKPTDDYVIAEYYELYGTDKEPQISWMNGKYFDANTTDEAYDVFVGWLVGDKKKSIKERSEENEIIVSELQDTVEYFCGLFEENGELKGNALKDLKNAVERLEVFNAIGSIYQWGVEVLNKCGVKYKGLKESKKSLKESAKAINERNVAKFVDELNEWCDDNIHFADPESAKSTREFGKLYDFQYDWDYSFGDKGELLVWDNEGTLDWFEESYVKDFIVKLAKKYGWYCEPCHSASDFMFAEL